MFALKNTWIGGTTLEDTDPVRRTRSGSQKIYYVIFSSIMNTTKYRNGYNLALTKDLGIYNSKGIIYLAL